MKWTAEHFDGLTERLLSYRLCCDDGAAELTARWFWPRPGCREFRSRFALDDSTVRQALADLRSLDTCYEASWEDQCRQRLIIELDAEVIDRRVSGGGVLVAEQPELRPFLVLFQWVEKEVLAQLPFGP